MAKKHEFKIRQGETFQQIIRWEQPTYSYKAITDISNSAPIQITVPSHGLASGWRVAVVSVEGMTQINAKYAPPRDSDFEQVTVLTADTLALNRINSSDFDVYDSGGYLQFYLPVDLTGYSARMEIKDHVGGTVLLSLTSGAPDNRIVLDNNAHTITLTVSATDTALLTFQRGVYDLELVSPSGVVTTLYSGDVLVTKEVTT